MKDLIKDIESRFEVSDYIQKLDHLAFVTVEKEQAIALVTYLRDYRKFTSLTLLTAVDWLEDGVFQLTYLLNNPSELTEIGVRVMIDRENASMESAHHLWENMMTYQRELREMFGIDFPGSPRINEDFILEGWGDLPPYRRDFDTKVYSEETYFPRPGRQSNDPATYMKSKMYPNE
ncbi:MAG: NADH-quinone oxidoreductase subunit C [Bacteroidales bacterium]|nr:NADH-quinone oxidoreductase subunit C [Bacteroidales bacterium]